MAADATSAPNGAATSAAEPSTSIGGDDPLSRLEAAGFGDEDEAYEDISDLGQDEPAEGEESPAATEGEPDDEMPEDDEEGAEKKPADALGLKGKGSREQPLRHKDIPADKFVKLKAPDGSEVVVSLKDAVSGVFLSRAMVDRHVSVAKDAEVRAKAIATRAIEHTKRANARLQATLTSPEGLLKALVENHMPVLIEVAKATARMKKNPELRTAVLSEMREKRLVAQTREVAQQRQALDRQAQETAQQAQLEQTLAPAYKRGLKEAGILRKEDITDDLRDGIRMRYQFMLNKHGRPPTPDEMRWCVTDAAADLKAKGKLAPPKRPMAAPKPPEQPASGRAAANGKIDWSKVPESIRMSDPRFLFDKAARASVRSARS